MTHANMLSYPHLCQTTLVQAHTRTPATKQMRAHAPEQRTPHVHKMATDADAHLAGGRPCELAGRGCADYAIWCGELENNECGGGGEAQ